MDNLITEEQLYIHLILGNDKLKKLKEEEIKLQLELSSKTLKENLRQLKIPDQEEEEVKTPQEEF